MPTTPARLTTDAVLAALADHPGATAAELATAASLGRSTATKGPAPEPTTGARSPDPHRLGAFG